MEDTESVALLSRNDDIMDAVRNGEPFTSIGKRHGISGERVRQLAAPHLLDKDGNDIRIAARKRKADERYTAALEQIKVVAAANPNMTPAEIARTVGPHVTTQDVTDTLEPTDLLRRHAIMRPALGRRYTTKDVIKALRKVSGRDRKNTVTMTAYRDADLKDAPSSGTILALFGTWTAACEAADVPVGVSVSGRPSQKWSDEQLIELAVAFFTEVGVSGTMVQYDAWAKTQVPKGPSTALMRQQIGSWGEVRRQAADLIAASNAA